MNRKNRERFLKHCAIDKFFENPGELFEEVVKEK